MIEPRDLNGADLDAIRHLIPGPDPVVNRDQRFIPVADTRLDGNEMEYLRQCVESNWISSIGPFVGRFEQQFAAAVGCEHGVACANGTVALHLTLAALGIGPGDEVILPAFTMIAVANAVSYTGATPVLVDVDPETWNINPELIEAVITPRTRAIIAVHTYGYPADMDAITAIAGRHGLIVIEDAAEAHGAGYRGRRAGNLARAAAFSFYANKIITTGEGGMITTNDGELARVARTLRDHAFSHERHFWHRYRGFNYRMTNMQAAVGLAQLERLEQFVAQRRANARLYTELLGTIRGLTLPRECPDGRNVFWMYGALVGDASGISRDELRACLAARGIETRTFFIPIHFQPVWFEQFRGQRFPVSETLCQRGLYLPSGATLRAADVHLIAEEVRRSLGKPGEVSGSLVKSGEVW
ncbi:MAG: DegT/DnrJ/EryC1/StrS family aminotransferase [Blastocatellia bacterium]